jgi:hypothetical protein
VLQIRPEPLHFDRELAGALLQQGSWNSVPS